MRKREEFALLAFRSKSKQPNSSGSLPRGFTLIELLVVIAIIALLMSILMPALDRAKNQAKAAICQSNLHQWGTVFTIYVADHDGRLMPGNRGGDEDEPPPIGGWSPHAVTSNMSRFCINRHTEHIQGVFLDGTTRKVGLKELWKLEWHRDWPLVELSTIEWLLWMAQMKEDY